MTNIEIVDNNIIIADFADFSYQDNLGWYDVDMNMAQIVYDDNNGNCFYDLLFDKSWDWLMPVVLKCYEYEELDNNYREQIVASLSGVIDIEDTYKAVVDFIVWYNSININI